MIITEEWRVNGKLDRADEPAELHRDRLTGVVWSESWYRDGKRHREDGPAEIYRDPVTGAVTKEDWYQNGQKVESQPRLSHSLKGNTPAI